MKNILTIGPKFSGLTDYLDNHDIGYQYLVDISKTKFPDKEFKFRVLADFSSDDQLLAAVDAIRQPIDGVMTVYENCILPTAKIAQHLHLPGLPLSAARACADKSLMRSLFAKAPAKISPDFAIIKTTNDATKFAEQHDFPLILKPANLTKSLLVTKNHNLPELLKNLDSIQNSIDKIYQQYAPHNQPKIIIEEFLEGSVHSVDAFVDNTGQPHILKQIVDYQTGYDIGYDDNFHYSRILPSKLTPNQQIELLNCAEIGVKALSMKSSPAHIEIIMTADGPRIVEIGARNGGYRERMHRLANGIDITGNAIKLALGQTPIITASKNDPIAVLELFPKTAGQFVGIKNQTQLESLKSLNYFSLKAKPGECRGKSSDGYKMCTIVILHNSDLAQFEADLDFINNNVSVITH
jgi:hypothetical protein